MAVIKGPNEWKDLRQYNSLLKYIHAIRTQLILKYNKNWYILYMKLSLYLSYISIKLAIITIKISIISSVSRRNLPFTFIEYIKLQTKLKKKLTMVINRNLFKEDKV